MSVIGILRSKRVWIGLAVSVIILIIMGALGAALIVSGVISESGQFRWICGSYLAASLVGGLIARKGSGGSMISTMTNMILLMLFIVLLSLILYGGISLSSGEWRILPFAVAGAVLAGLLGMKKGGKKTWKKRAASMPKMTSRRR